MGIFRSHREAAEANNRVLGRFSVVIVIWTAVFAAAVLEHYWFGWW